MMPAAAADIFFCQIHLAKFSPVYILDLAVHKVSLPVWNRSCISTGLASTASVHARQPLPSVRDGDSIPRLSAIPIFGPEFVFGLPPPILFQGETVMQTPARAPSSLHRTAAGESRKRFHPKYRFIIIIAGWRMGELEGRKRWKPLEEFDAKTCNGFDCR